MCKDNLILHIIVNIYLNQNYKNKILKKYEII